MKFYKRKTPKSKTLTLENNFTVGTAGGGTGNITIQSTGGIVVSGNRTITLAGNWSNSGSFTSSVGAVLFNGTAAQTISGSEVTTFYDVNVTNSSASGLTISSPTPGKAIYKSDITVDGTLPGGLIVGPGTGYWDDGTP